MYDMINIFEVFLPQLLRYPNPTDPLNGEAAALMMRDQKGYDAKVKGACSVPEPRGRTCWLTRPGQSTSPNMPPRNKSTRPAMIATTAMR